MFLSSVALYLITRKSTLLKTPTVWNNLMNFFLPLLVYLVIVAGKGEIHWQFEPQVWGVLIFSAIFFSYLGQLISFKSIEVAPNIGFSLVISKSYVVLTTLLAVVFFKANLTWLAILAIFAIIGFSALISIDPNAKPNPNVQPRWFPLALVSFFCWGFLAMSSKYLLNNGMPVLERLIFSMSIVSLIIGGDIWRGKHNLNALSKIQILYLLGMGLTAASFNYFTQLAFTTAPNIGYVNAINTASIAIVTILSAVFFKDELTWRKFIGVLGVCGGLVLLVLGS